MTGLPIPRAWAGETCVIIAGGPSVRELDRDLLLNAYPRQRIITINDSWRICPHADVHYFCDARWWVEQTRLNRKCLDKAFDFGQMTADGAGAWCLGLWVTGAYKDFSSHPSVWALRLTGQQGLATDPSELRTGSNSGYQAINLAYHFGAKRILLLGFDMKVTDRTHWHNEERSPAAAFRTTLALSMLPHFPTLVEPLRAAGVEVINCTPGSALTCWPYVPLKEALQNAHPPETVTA